MNHRMVAEFSALVAAQAPLIIEGSTPLADGPLSVYWQHGKTYWPRRRRELDELCDIAADSDDSAVTEAIVSIASDLLVGELLTRVAGAILTACDRRQRLRRAEPIARAVLTVHQQCRTSVLHLLLHSTCVPADQLAELDRLRRRVERWTDLLLGPLVAHYGNELADFAFDPRRARDFGDDQLEARFTSTSRPSWSFLLAGLQSAFPNRVGRTSSNDAVMPILRSIIAIFPEDAFQTDGPIHSLQHVRLVRALQQIEGPAESPDAPHLRLRTDGTSASHQPPQISRRRAAE